MSHITLVRIWKTVLIEGFVEYTIGRGLDLNIR